MKRMAALMGALLLTLVMAAPAMANQKVHIDSESGSFVIPDPDWGIGPTVRIAEDSEIWRLGFEEDWACTKDIFYRLEGKGDLWLWYPKGVDTTDEDEYMPEFAAWPWIKGKSNDSGVDYFHEKADMTGKVASGKFGTSSRMYDHHLGSPGMADPETWKVQTTGKFWGINLPGMGTVIHQSGNERGTLVVYLPDKIFDDLGFHFRGNSTFDYGELCEYLGAGPALSDLPPFVPAP